MLEKKQRWDEDKKDRRRRGVKRQNGKRLDEKRENIEGVACKNLAKIYLEWC